MGLSSDHYKYAGPEPTIYVNLDDDVKRIVQTCMDLNYDYYMYGGLVMQMQPTNYVYGSARFFVSFQITNDGYQHLYEASGEGLVINADTSDSPLQDFLDAMKENLLPRLEKFK